MAFGKKCDLTVSDLKRDWSCPPNLISFTRFLLVIPVSILLLRPGIEGWIGFLLFALAALTDKLDGWLAKRNNGRWTTKLGKALDPAVDKVFVLLTLLVSAIRSCGTFRVVILMVFVAIMFREVVVIYVKSQQNVKSANEAGRFSMVAQSVATGALLLPFQATAWHMTVLVLLGIGVGASLCSGWLYWATWRAECKRI